MAYDSDTDPNQLRQCVLGNVPLAQRYGLNYKFGDQCFQVIKYLCLGKKIQPKQIPVKMTNYEDTVPRDILKLL